MIFHKPGLSQKECGCHYFYGLRIYHPLFDTHPHEVEPIINNKDFIRVRDALWRWAADLYFKDKHIEVALADSPEELPDWAQ